MAQGVKVNSLLFYSCKWVRLERLTSNPIPFCPPCNSVFPLQVQWESNALFTLSNIPLFFFKGKFKSCFVLVIMSSCKMTFFCLRDLATYIALYFLKQYLSSFRCINDVLIQNYSQRSSHKNSFSDLQTRNFFRISKYLLF